jgi:hypothetical protein
LSHAEAFAERFVGSGYGAASRGGLFCALLRGFIFVGRRLSCTFTGWRSLDDARVNVPADGSYKQQGRGLIDWPINEITAKIRVNRRTSRFAQYRLRPLRRIPLAGLNTGLDRLLREGVERHAGIR